MVYTTLIGYSKCGVNRKGTEGNEMGRGRKVQGIGQKMGLEGNGWEGKGR